MTNPIEWFEGLPTKGKIAVAAGGAGVLLFVWQPWKKKASPSGDAGSLQAASYQPAYGFGTPDFSSGSGGGSGSGSTPASPSTPAAPTAPVITPTDPNALKPEDLTHFGDQITAAFNSELSAITGTIAGLSQAQAALANQFQQLGATAPPPTAFQPTQAAPTKTGTSPTPVSYTPPVQIGGTDTAPILTPGKVSTPTPFQEITSDPTSHVNSLPKEVSAGDYASAYKADLQQRAASGDAAAQKALANHWY